MMTAVVMWMALLVVPAVRLRGGNHQNRKYRECGY
jgi:hypothetical protein